MHLPTTTLLALAAAFLLPAATLAKVSCTGVPAGLSDILVCADYLKSLGSQACKVTGGLTAVFCERNNAQIVGNGVGAVGVKTSSPCVDIAMSAKRILRACTLYGNSPLGLGSAGRTDADDNGDIVVAVGLKVLKA